MPRPARPTRPRPGPLGRIHGNRIILPRWWTTTRLPTSRTHCFQRLNPHRHRLRALRTIDRRRRTILRDRKQPIPAKDRPKDHPEHRRPIPRLILPPGRRPTPLRLPLPTPQGPAPRPPIPRPRPAARSPPLRNPARANRPTSRPPTRHRPSIQPPWPNRVQRRRRCSIRSFRS